MKGLAKFTLIAAGIVAAILVASIIILKSIVTPERIKETVLPVAQQALHREVTLRGVNMSIFSGIELQGLTIMDRKGKSPFVSCEAARLHYDLMPLLQGRVQIHEVTIVSPLIQVTRNSDGTFNFSDLLSADKSQKPGDSADIRGVASVENLDRTVTAKAETRSAAGERSASTPEDGLAIAISRINIENGKVIFSDHAAPGGKSVETTLSALNLNVDDFSTTSPFMVTLETRLNNGRITATGTIGLTGPHVEMKLTVSDLAVTDFAPYFASALPGKLQSALINTDLNLTYASSGINSSGKIAMEQVSFIPKDSPEAALKNAFAELDHDINFNKEMGTLAIRSAKLSLNGIKIDAKGNITGIGGKPVMALDITLPQQAVAAVIKALPAAYIAKAEAFRPEGKLSASLSLSGKLDKGARLIKRATISLNGLAAIAEGIPVGADGKLIIDVNRLNTKGLVLKVGKSDIKTELTAKNLFSKPVTIRSKMTADEIDLDTILAARTDRNNEEGTFKKPVKSADGERAGKGRRKAGKDGKLQAKTPEAAPLDLPLDAAGTLHVALLRYRNTPIKDVNIRYTLRNNKLHVTQTARVAGGEIEKKLDLDLGVKGYRYKGNFNVSNVLAQQLVAYASPAMGKTISGILDLHGDFSGEGIDTASLKQNLNLKGNWSLIEGTLARTGLVSGLVSFLNLENDLKNINIKNAKGDFKIQDGKVIFKGKFSSDKINLSPEGTVSLDGDMNIRLNAVLSPELASKLPAGQFLTPMKDSRGWSILPLMVKGTWSAPSFTLDTAAVTDQAAGFIKNKLLGIGDSKNDQTNNTEPQQDGEKKPQEQLLEHAIKGLFGN